MRLVRLVIVIAVIALLADVLINDSAYTRAAYRDLSIAADRFVSAVRDTVNQAGSRR